MANNARKLTIDDYEITRDGHCINKITGRKQSGIINEKGYIRISIGQRKYYLHRLVATKYVPNPDKKPCVNHIDGNKLNNNADNLEWCTNAENSVHAQRTGLLKVNEQCSWTKLSINDVSFIREHTELSSKEIAEMFSIHPMYVCEIRRGIKRKNG